MNFFQDSLLQKNTYLRSFTTLLCEGAENHLIYTKEKPSDLTVSIKKINDGLFKGKKNNRNLVSSVVQLISLLQQCPQYVLNVEGERWVTLCLQNLSNPNESLVKCLLAIISFILKASHGNKELSKKLSKSSLMLVERLSRCHISVREQSFKCLYEDLRLFPNQALTQRKYIEVRLMKVLSSPLNWHRDLVYAAASVYAALPIPGGGGGSASEMKGRQLEQLISLSHHAADAVFYDIKESEKYEFSRDHKLPIETIDSVWKLKDPLMRVLTASLILSNCFEFINIFFERCLLQFIMVKLKDLVNLCFRILQVEPQSLRGKESMEIRAIFFILPTLHSRVLILLKTLIQNNVCPFTMNLVVEHLISTLKSTSTNKKPVKGEGESSDTESMLQSFLTVRIQCYEALSETAKISNGISGIMLEGLVSNLIQDTTPIKDTITLKQAIVGGRLSLVNAKKKSKKKGYSVTSAQCQNVSHDVSVPQAVEQKIPLTLSALRLIEALFTYAHHSVPLKYVKVLQDHLMTLLKTRRSGIYGDERVREALYSAIIANVMYPHPLCPPPYNFIYQALQDEALYSRDQVSGICMKGLSALAFITSNPNTANWSDIVSLNKESKEVKTDQVADEPLLNGDINEGESDMSNDEEEDDDDDDVENEPLGLNMDNSEDDDEDVDNSEENDVDDDCDNKKMNGIVDETEEVMKISGHLNNSNGEDLEDENQSAEDLEESEEDSFGAFEMNMNENNVDEESEEEEEIDIDDLESEEEGEVNRLIVNEEEEEVLEEEETNTNVGVKRRTESAPGQIKKKSKVESGDEEEISPTRIADMLASFVDAEPDTDSDDGR